MDRSIRQKINKETIHLKDSLEQMELIDIYRKFHPKTAENTFFSSAHETFHRIDHMLSHKTSRNKFRKIKIISSIFCDHNGIKLEITRKKLEKTQTYGD